MSIKSLLLGSAAALAVVSGAQAADAIVAAEPEPAEYVKVCDAFGAGYFYIPGTETCLKIGGYVRYQIGFGTDVDSAIAGNQNWDQFTKADLNLSAKSDSELGEVGAQFELNANNDFGGATFGLDSASLSVGGFKAGYYAGFWDNGIGENSTWAKNSKFNSVAYTFSNDAFSAGLQVDETGEAGPNKQNQLGLEAMVGGVFGPASAKVIGVYDNTAEKSAVKGILSADIGPGSLALAFLYSSGKNVYSGDVEWSTGAAYSIKATDSLTFMPEWQLVRNIGGSETWFVGALTSYQIAPGLAASLDVNYNKDETVGGYFRLQRSF